MRGWAQYILDQGMGEALVDERKMGQCGEDGRRGGDCVLGRAIRVSLAWTRVSENEGDGGQGREV